MHAHGRGDVRELHKARHGPSAAHELQLAEARLADKEAAQLVLVGGLAEVADEERVAWRVVLGVVHRDIAARRLHRC